MDVTKTWKLTVIGPVMIWLIDSVALQRSADCSLEWSSPVQTRSSTLALELHDSNTLIHNKAWFTYTD